MTNKKTIGIPTIRIQSVGSIGGTKAEGVHIGPVQILKKEYSAFTFSSYCVGENIRECGFKYKDEYYPCVPNNGVMTLPVAVDLNYGANYPVYAYAITTEGSTAYSAPTYVGWSSVFKIIDDGLTRKNPYNSDYVFTNYLIMSLAALYSPTLYSDGYELEIDSYQINNHDYKGLLYARYLDEETETFNKDHLSVRTYTTGSGDAVKRWLQVWVGPTGGSFFNSNRWGQDRGEMSKNSSGNRFNVRVYYNEDKTKISYDFRKWIGKEDAVFTTDVRVISNCIFVGCDSSSLFIQGVRIKPINSETWTQNLVPVKKILDLPDDVMAEQNIPAKYDTIRCQFPIEYGFYDTVNNKYHNLIGNSGSDQFASSYRMYARNDQNPPIWNGWQLGNDIQDLTPEL